MFPCCRGGGPITCSNDAVSSARRPESCVFRYDKEKFLKLVLDILLR